MCFAILEPEIKAFMEQLPRMLSEHEGEYTVFKGNQALGFWKDRTTAEAEGLRVYGVNVPMLIRQVSAEYTIYGRYGKPIFMPHPFIGFLSAELPDDTRRRLI